MALSGSLPQINLGVQGGPAPFDQRTVLVHGPRVADHCSRGSLSILKVCHHCTNTPCIFNACISLSKQRGLSSTRKCLRFDRSKSGRVRTHDHMAKVCT
ncbi:hypothetical protein TNCV_3625161 [Trichonephila clavipes]|nr:hypothetical protein TNCV_3625161 [Trichonephila clavipes]